MWQLLLPLALWPGVMGLGRDELTAAQHRGLQVALEEFHKHPPVQWAFRETSVDSAMDTPFPAGTFVRLEFKLQQTNCRKKDWKKAECKVKPSGRKRKCLACIKLDPEDKVLGRMVHCPIETQVQRVRALGGGSRGWGGSWWTETGPVGEVGGGSLHGGARRALGLGDGGVEGAQPEQCGCRRSCRSCRSARRPSAGGRSAPARTLTATTSPGSSPSSKPCPPAEA
uniref:Retinoic acid receptor responder protein 2 n=1 Tax=Phocoena sinus TaxID=42100 RepID=A0A8C9E0D9_PHOSS